MPEEMNIKAEIRGDRAVSTANMHVDSPQHTCALIGSIQCFLNELVASAAKDFNIPVSELVETIRQYSQPSAQDTCRLVTRKPEQSE